jgi:hypothetical protein
MKKRLFALPVILLVAAGCNSSSPQPTVERNPSTSQIQNTQSQQQVAQNTNPTPTPSPTSTLTATPGSKLKINSVSGPTTLIVGQAGTWTINASDSVSNKLSYGAIFGDEGKGGNYPANYDVSLANSQSPILSHAYQNSLNYAVNFVVKDDKGNYARKIISINVKLSATAAINIISPIGGETWQIGETHNITWTSTDVKNVYIYLTYYNSNGVQEASEPITPIGGAPASQGTFSWTIQNQMYPNGASVLSPAGQTFKISINEAGGTTQATSNFFNIVQ